MKSYLIIISLLFFINSLFSQNQYADSLIKIWNNLGKADTVRLEALDYAIWEYMNSDIDLAIKLTF